MNNLSWLIYFAGVAGNLSSLFFTITAVAGLVFISSLFMFAINSINGGFDWRGFKKFAFLSLPFVIIFGSLGALVPEKETVYAIAASEVGEKIITNERVIKTTNKAFDALDNWLTKNSKEEPAK